MSLDASLTSTTSEWGFSDSTPNYSPAASGDTGLPEIDPAELEFDEKIGEGSYGQVFCGRCRGKQVAIKVFKPDMFQTEEERQAIREEVKIMKLLLITKFQGNNVMIVSEKMPTDLETLLIRESKPIPLVQRMRMAKDAALGMNWLHSSNPIFIHRDLKLSNLLVDDNYRVNVCDFGLAQMKPRDIATLEYDPHGSPLYMAPEVFVGDYNEKCDIYSFGIVLWEIYTQTQAFEQVSDNLPKFIHAVCDDNFRPEIPEDCPSRIAALMEACWQKDARKRPTFSEIIGIMDNIIVDIALSSDRDACEFWKSHFAGKEIVSWDDFQMQLSKYLKVPISTEEMEIQWKCMHAVLAEKPKDILGKKDVVNIEQFGKVLCWFGPLNVKQPTMLEKIKETLAEKWFHGNIGQQEAEDRLQNQPKGTYLIRFSGSAPGCFTISHISKKKKLMHQRVTHVPGEGFYFWDSRYEDLRTLIKNERKEQYFSVPAPGSSYQKLFPKKKTKETVVEIGYVVPGRG